jgi:hypothetical protein
MQRSSRIPDPPLRRSSCRRFLTFIAQFSARKERRKKEEKPLERKVQLGNVKESEWRSAKENKKRRAGGKVVGVRVDRS